MEQSQEMPPEYLDQMLANSQMMNNQANQNQGSALTQAATESLMRGMTPAI